VNSLRVVVAFLTYSNVFIAACAVGLVFTNQLMAGESLVYGSNTLFVFFSTLFTYSVLKFRRGESDSLTHHQAWAGEHPQLHRNIVLVSLLGVAAFFFTLPKAAQLYALGLGVLTALYGFVSIPLGSKGVKLRNVGLLKTVFVAVVWSVSTVMIPLAGTGIDPLLLVFLLLRRFLFVLALTICFEIKDMEADSSEGLRTLPMLLGLTGTKVLAQAVLILLMLINTLQYFAFSADAYDTVAVNLSLLISIAVIYPIKENFSPYWYYIGLDGMMLLQFVLVYFARYFFA
jgi:4-hydroxybenzoate polyprenyltransferase